MINFEEEQITNILTCIPHKVKEFGIEARKEGEPFELAFNGPIQTWTDNKTGELKYAVAIRLAKIKDSTTKELYSKNLLFYCPENFMHEMHNLYDFISEIPYTEFIPSHSCFSFPPLCLTGINKNLEYIPNEENVILEDLRFEPIQLNNGSNGWFVTGQGYRGKLKLPNGVIIHDVGVYGNYVDPNEQSEKTVLYHLFGGLKCIDKFALEFQETDKNLIQVNDNLWIKGISVADDGEMNLLSCKNSVLLPREGKNDYFIGARTMTETKKLFYFGSSDKHVLGHYDLRGEITGLKECFPESVWNAVRRVGLGSNFVEVPELDAYVGMVHIVFSKNDPSADFTKDEQHPDIVEQYEGWMVLMKFIDGIPHIIKTVRAILPDDMPKSYHGNGDLFKEKRVAFPTSIYQSTDKDFNVAYGWGDRAIFSATIPYEEVINQFR